jgi:hypothetical protein
VTRPSGERVEYQRWLLERALLDAQLIALGMQSIGVHFERMVTDDPEFGAARATTNFADYHHELRANVHRSIEFMRRAQGCGLEPVTGCSLGALAYPSRMGQSGSKTLSCRGDCGTVKLGCYFHTHDFEQHAGAPTVIEMRKTTKGLREWS